ncbi:MAG: proton-conducting transporter membrane subunit [Acidimicrobiales bacterium]
METLDTNNWLLTVLVFAPLAGALLMALIPKDEDDTHKQVALLTSLVTLGLGIYLLVDFDYDQAGVLQYFASTEWIKVIGAGYTVGVDGMSLPLIALTVLVMPLVFVYSWNHIPEPGNTKAFLMLMLILETGMIGTFVAQDLILFFVFFEVVLLPMFFMIAVWGGPDRRYASLKFFLYTLFGSALMLLSFLALFFLVKDPATGELLRTFNMPALSNAAGAGSSTPRS